jgi:hypothetical protein
MIRYSNKPILRKVKAVYLRDFGEMGTFQNNFVISIRKKVQTCPAFEIHPRSPGVASSNLGTFDVKAVDR